MKYFFERSSFGKTHKPWLTDEVIPLNYADFDNQMRYLLSEFGVNPDNVTIPQESQVPLDPVLDALTPSDEAEIRSYCQEDYDFLASKGITFS
jgi:hypothetical protein